MAGPTDFSDDRGWPLMPTWGKIIEERLAFYSWMGSRLAGVNVGLTQSDWTAQADYPEMEKHVNAISPVSYRDQAWVDEAIKWLEIYTFTFENAR